MKTIFLISFIFIFGAVNSKSTDFFLGAGAKVGYIFPTEDLISYKNAASCCDDFSKVSSTIPQFNLNLGYHYNDHIEIAFLFAYENSYVQLENNSSFVFGIDGELVEGEFLNVYQNKFRSYIVGFEATCIFYYGFGLTVQSAYRQNSNIRIVEYEQMIKPENIGVFPDSGTRIRNQRSAEISANGEALVGLNLFKNFPLDVDRKNSLRIGLFLNHSLNEFNDEIGLNRAYYGLSFAFLFGI